MINCPNCKNPIDDNALECEWCDYKVKDVNAFNFKPESCRPLLFVFLIVYGYFKGKVSNGDEFYYCVKGKKIKCLVNSIALVNSKQLDGSNKKHESIDTFDGEGNIAIFFKGLSKRDFSLDGKFEKINKSI